MKKLIISLIMMVLLSSMVFAVTRGVSGTTVTYTASTSFNIGIAKAYWSIEDSISGCTLNSVSKTSCGSNCEYSVISGKIRLVAYTPEAGGTVGNSKSITLSGSGTGCTLSGSYAEAPGVAGSLMSMGSSSIDLEVACNTDADTNCNGIVADSELLSYANLWMAGSISDTQLLQAASAWLGG